MCDILNSKVVDFFNLNQKRLVVYSLLEKVISSDGYEVSNVCVFRHVS